MTWPGETEASSAGRNHAEDACGRIDALKIPARSVEYSRTESALSPFRLNQHRLAFQGSQSGLGRKKTGALRLRSGKQDPARHTPLSTKVIIAKIMELSRRFSISGLNRNNDLAALGKCSTKVLMGPGPRRVLCERTLPVDRCRLGCGHEGSKVASRFVGEGAQGDVEASGGFFEWMVSEKERWIGGTAGMSLGARADV